MAAARTRTGSVSPARSDLSRLTVNGDQFADGIHETMGVVRALEMLVGTLAADGQEALAVRVAAATETLRRRTGYAEHEPERRAVRQADSNAPEPP
jgi:hypothetical protein